MCVCVCVCVCVRMCLCMHGCEFVCMFRNLISSIKENGKSSTLYL